MKSKLYKIMGVALVVVLLASLMAGLAAAPAGAETAKLKFKNLVLPKVEVWTDEDDFANPTEGHFWATPGIDPGPIAVTPDGEVLFAAVADGPYFASGWYHVLKSVDGGYEWVATGFFAMADFATDTSEVVDIVTSPGYDEDTTVVVATQRAVYISDDAGKTFIQVIGPWAGTENITDLDVTLDEDEDLAVMVGTTNTAGDGDVYVQKGLTPFTAQLITGYDVLACAFLPTFGADGDIGICAVVTEPNFDDSGFDEGPPDPDDPDGSTVIMFSFGDTNIPDPLAWGGSIANGPFTNAEGFQFPSVYARIAFPDDFDAFGVGNNVCFVGLTTAFNQPMLGSRDGSDAYKVICKEAGTSTGVDLDVRDVLTTLLPTATAITSIDVCGEAEEATILVGTDCLNLLDTPFYFLVYRSDDSGDTWVPATKQPTGGTRAGGPLDPLTFRWAMTRVVMDPDFCGGSTAYCTTMGMYTDAFQRSIDGGDCWNQISIIDYGLNGGFAYGVTATGMSPAGFTAAKTARMVTQFSSGPAVHGAVWETTNAGKNWERIFSYANAGVTDEVSQLAMTMDGSAWFAVDYTNCVMWRTTDGGCFWKQINLKGPPANAPVSWFWPVSATNFYTGHYGGDHNIWWTDRSGVGWDEPEDNDAAGLMIANIWVGGDKIVIGTLDGKVYVSDDAGETIQRVGVNDPGNPEEIVAATTDLGFDANNIIYAVRLGDISGGFPPPPPPAAIPGGGVWRCEVNWDDPADSEWVQIDDFQDATGPVVYDAGNFAAGGPAFALPPCDVLYICDGALVDTDPDPDDYAGGLWRCTNPTADIDSIHPPYFERENNGLTDGDMLAYLAFDMAPPGFEPTHFFLNMTEANYWEQVVIFTDTLNSGVPLVDPANDDVGVGLLAEGYVYPEVILSWQEKPGATSYQYEVALDADFKSKVDEGCGFTDSQVSPELRLQPNKTYYWHVRVADEGSIIGAPLISPWSETYKFKTAIGAVKARPDLEAPWPGEPDVDLKPTFEWSGIEWAVKYDYELAADPTTGADGYFTAPLKSLTGADALVSTAWLCDLTLDYSTRYYWHVKAIGEETETPWSDVGTFTTMGVPPEPVEPAPPIVVPPAEQITPAWIWAIVIIGAILVIAVIVLIVTTRRVP